MDLHDLYPKDFRTMIPSDHTKIHRLWCGNDSRSHRETGSCLPLTVLSWAEMKWTWSQLKWSDYGESRRCLYTAQVDLRDTCFLLLLSHEQPYLKFGLSLIFWYQHTAGQIERFQSRLMIKGTTLTIGRLYIPFIVHTVTTRTLPSPPGWTSMIRARGHFIRAIGSSRKHTIQPTWRLCDRTGHLDSFSKLVRYSVDQCCQKCCARAWHKRQRCSKYIEAAGSSIFGKASRGAPTRKCPGVRASVPSSGCGRGVRGLEFKHASICVKTVVNSSTVNQTPPTIHRK